MNYKTINTVIVSLIVKVLAFEDLIYVYGEDSQDMLDNGRAQYQLLRERGKLPQYGTCWKSAIAHINEGCRQLSEDTQSDIALHLTNCFLEMSGHETYNCELDKKPNLRGICINSMTDRAFNVYTEFYTHTQNICWFLRGQIWHETIAENTLRVGKQLELTAENQLELLAAQKESLQVQERMLQHGQFLEKVLEELYNTTQNHQDILRLTAETVVNLQGWIVGEFAWIDSILFYSLAIIFTFILTSTKRTLNSRLPMLILLAINLLLERGLIYILIKFNSEQDTATMHHNIYFYTWLLRYIFMLVNLIGIIYWAFYYKDALDDIVLQNRRIIDILLSLTKNNNNNNSNINNAKINVINESGRKSLEYKLNKLQNDYKSPEFEPHLVSTPIRNINEAKESFMKSTNLTKPKVHPFLELQNDRYNLRSRQGTPDN